MEINFVEYLINKGYTFQRYLNLKWTDAHYSNEFSSMTEGGISIRLKKDNSIFHYGLHSFNLPPTLITPEPSCPQEQREMIDFISKNTNEEIFNKFYFNSLQ